MTNLGWMDQALCAQADPDAWSPDKGAPSAAIKAVCRRCPVRTPCLEFALATGMRYGIYGGMSWPERRKVAASRQAVAA